MKILTEWFRRIKEYPALADELEQVKSDLRDHVSENVELYKQLTSLSDNYDKLHEIHYNELEEYWNNKRQKKLITWHARDGVKMDVRCFFQNDATLPKFTGTNDEIVADTLAWAILNLHYQQEKGEFWQYAYETMLTKTGDCEDGAILMANILLNSGVPDWRIRLNKGYVTLGAVKGYHCWLTYLAEDNVWRMVDWAYWPEESRDLKLKWKDAERYFSCDASWNINYSFSGLNKD